MSVLQRLLLTGMILVGLIVNSDCTLSAEGVAPRPPMGWNSFDAYDSAINESQFRATVDFLADQLKDYGWVHAVVDYIWFNPYPGDYNNPNRRFGQSDLRLERD